MFKWFLILNLLVLLMWLFAKDYLPEKCTQSETAALADDVLFSLKKQADSILSPQNRYDGKVLNLSSDDFNKFIRLIEETDKESVIFFYDPNSILSRLALRKINDIAGKYNKGDVVFLIIAFEDDKQELNTLLNSYAKLNFRPLYAEKSLQRMAEFAFIKNGLKLPDMPAIVYKSESGIHESVSAGGGINQRLEFLIEQRN